MLCCLTNSHCLFKWITSALPAFSKVFHEAATAKSWSLESPVRLQLICKPLYQNYYPAHVWRFSCVLVTAIHGSMLYFHWRLFNQLIHFASSDKKRTKTSLFKETFLLISTKYALNQEAVFVLISSEKWNQRKSFKIHPLAKPPQ